MRYFIFSVIAILVLLYFMPVVISINVNKDGKNDKISVGLRTLYGLLRLNTEVPFLIITIKDGKPVLKFKVEVANKKRSRLFARFSKLFSVPEGEKLYKTYKRNKLHLMPLLKYIAGKLKVKKFDLKLKIGTGEAAATGILYGVTWIAIGGLMSFASTYLNIREPRIAVVPVFSSIQFDMDFSCIISLKTGHIINTGIRAIPVLMSILREQRNIYYKIEGCV